MAVISTSPRFLTLADVAELLNTSSAQVYALVRRGDLPAIKLGGRGQWRIESTLLEEFIQRLYADTRVFVAHHPFDEPFAELGGLADSQVSDGSAARPRSRTALLRA